MSRLNIDSFSKNRVRVGWTLALLSALGFSITPPIARVAILSGMDSTELLATRFALAALLLWLTLLFRRPEQTKSIHPSDMGAIILAGFANGVGQICAFYALVRLEASLVSMIIATLPIFVLVILALRGEPLTARKLIRLALALIGLYLLIGPDGDADIVGLGLIAVGVLLVAVQFVLCQPLVYQYDTQTVTRYIITTMSVVVVAYWWIVDGSWQWPSLQGWIYIGLLSVISTYATRSLFFLAVDRLGSGQLSLMKPLETLMAILWSGILLGERLSLVQWAGGILVVVSTILAVQRINLGTWRPRWWVENRA